MADDVAGAPIAGAPLPEQAVDVKPLLEGAGESMIVSVHNPLSQDFRVQYARSVVQGGADTPYLTQEEKAVLEKGGIAPRKDQNPQAHAVQYLVLKSGQTINLPGDIAQIAVRQLVNYMIQVRAKGKSVVPLSDPVTRRQAEDEVVLNVNNSIEFFNKPSAEEYTDAQLKSINQKADGVKSSEPAPDPPPGQGVSYEPNAPAVN